MEYQELYDDDQIEQNNPQKRPFNTLMPWIVIWVLLIGGMLTLFSYNLDLPPTEHPSIANVLVPAAPTPTLLPQIAPGAISPIFAPQVLFWEKEITRWAANEGVDPNLVAIVMQIESCGAPKAVSHAGASGLFQVMPFHFGAGEDMFDPDTNARRGINYFSERLQQSDGDIGLAFAGYNGGHGATASSWDHWANETQRYYIWSTGIYNDINANLNPSPTLKKWMASGGASLCALASEQQQSLNSSP